MEKKYSKGGKKVLIQHVDLSTKPQIFPSVHLKLKVILGNKLTI